MDINFVLTGLAAAGTGAGTIVFGALQQFALDKLGLKWTLCIEALILSSGIICGLLLIPGPTSERKDQMQESNTISEDKRSCLEAVQDIFDFSLFKKPSYIFYCVGLALHASGYYIPKVFLPGFAISTGITAQDSANLVSVVGFANLISRLIFGYIGDLGPRLRLGLCGLSMVIMGMGGVALPFVRTYPIVFLIYAILFGTCVGCIVSLYSVILVDLFGVEKIGKSLGQALTFISPVYLFGSPLIGFLIDISGEVAMPFYIPGSDSVLAGLMFSSILCIHDFSHQGYRRIY